MKTVMIVGVILLLAAALVVGGGAGEKQSGSPGDGPAPMEAPAYGEVAVLAGGCFWGVEAVFEALDGVEDVVSGYSGGEAGTARYYEVARGDTDHAESVRIVFDPEVISYETLLEVFFTVAHDPTQLNFQGPDVGTQYRSAIFYADTNQKRAAEEYISKSDSAGTYTKPIVTELTPLEAFYAAEPDHQDFVRLNPDHPYVAYWDLPKLEKLEKEYPDLLEEG